MRDEASWTASGRMFQARGRR